MWLLALCGQSVLLKYRELCKLACRHPTHHLLLCRKRSARSQEGNDPRQDEPESEHTADRRKRLRPTTVEHNARFCRPPTLQLYLASAGQISWITLPSIKPVELCHLTHLPVFVNNSAYLPEDILKDAGSAAFKSSWSSSIYQSEIQGAQSHLSLARCMQYMAARGVQSTERCAALAEGKSGT